LYCNTIHKTTLHFNKYIKQHCIVIQYIKQHFIVIQYIKQYCIVIQYIKQHCILIQYIKQHCIAKGNHPKERIQQGKGKLLGGNLSGRHCVNRSPADPTSPTTQII